MKEINENKLLELEHRILVLKGWKEFQHSLFESINKDIDELKTKVNPLDRKIDEKFLALDQRANRFREEFMGQIIHTNRRIDSIAQKVNHFREEFDKKMNRFFLWMAGIQITILLIIIGILLRFLLCEDECNVLM